MYIYKKESSPGKIGEVRTESEGLPLTSNRQIDTRIKKIKKIKMIQQKEGRRPALLSTLLRLTVFRGEIRESLIDRFVGIRAVSTYYLVEEPFVLVCTE